MTKDNHIQVDTTRRWQKSYRLRTSHAGERGEIGEGAVGVTRAEQRARNRRPCALAGLEEWTAARDAHTISSPRCALIGAPGDCLGRMPAPTTGERPARQKQRRAGRLRDRGYDFLVLSALGLGFFLGFLSPMSISSPSTRIIRTLGWQSIRMLEVSHVRAPLQSAIFCHPHSRLRSAHQFPTPRLLGAKSGPCGGTPLRHTTAVRIDSSFGGWRAHTVMAYALRAGGVGT